MNRNLKLGLAVLVASAAVGVAAGFLIAPKSGKDSRRSLRNGIRRLSRGASRQREPRVVADRRASPPPPLVVTGPYPHS